MKRLRTSLDAALVAVVALVVAVVGASSGGSRAAILAARTGSAPPFTLAYTSYRGGLSGIFTMNANGSGRQHLTTLQPGFQGQPAYSPDGSRIAYVCGNFELCVMNADGTGQGRLTTSHWPKTWEYVDHPTWSPDGREIAFASNAEGKFHVYVINADGTGLHRLPGTSRNDDDPAWSPDGTTFAFDRYRSWSGGVSEIYLMNADGTQPHRLASGNLPSWSPDGSKIVSHDYDAGEDNLHLFLMTATGSGQRQLTSGSCDEIDPAFSPDGSTLAFDWDCRGRLGIALKVGRRIHRISAPQHGFDSHPAWRPTATGGPATTPIAPPSTPTGDALLASSYFQWGAQVTIDILPAGDVTFSPPGPRMLRRILADDRHALAAFRAARPETAKGKRLQRTATAAFRLLSAAARQYLLCDRAAARGKTRAADRYRDAGERLLELSDQKFIAADNIGTLPYPY